MITTIRKPDYVVNRIEGIVTLKELIDYARQNVESWLSDPVLYDMTDSRMTSDDSDYQAVKSLVGNIHELVESRKGKRTAIVAPDPFTYGILRMAITIVECTEHRLVASVFTDLETAIGWLKRIPVQGMA